jgi:hypothetical protein
MVAIAEPRARDPKPTVSIVPDGTDLFFALFPSTSYWATFVGSLAPKACGACGTDFLQPPSFAIVIATSYVDAHGQPPDGVGFLPARWWAVMPNPGARD